VCGLSIYACFATLSIQKLNYARNAVIEIDLATIDLDSIALFPISILARQQLRGIFDFCIILLVNLCWG